jgi:hypothetical protein
MAGPSLPARGATDSAYPRAPRLTVRMAANRDEPRLKVSAMPSDPQVDAPEEGIADTFTDAPTDAPSGRSRIADRLPLAVHGYSARGGVDMGVFDYEASTEEYERRQEERQAAGPVKPRRIFDQAAQDPGPAQAGPAGTTGRAPAGGPPPASRPAPEPGRAAQARARPQPPPAARARPNTPTRPEPPPGTARAPAPPAGGRRPPERSPGPGAPRARERAQEPPAPAAAGQRPPAPAPDGAAEQLARAAGREGWAIAIQRRRDVERALGRPLRGEEWQRIRASRWWNDAVPEAMRQAATALLPTMLASLGVTDDDEDR